MTVSRVVLGAVIVTLSIFIALALVTGKVLAFDATIADAYSYVLIRTYSRSEQPVYFWLAVFSFACALVVAIWTAVTAKHL